MKTININRLETICGSKLDVFRQNALNGLVKEYEETVRSELKREIEYKYNKDLATAVDCFLVAIAFTLHFGETTKFGQKRIDKVLGEIQTTVDLLGGKEYSIREYEQMLRDDGIYLNIKF